MSVDKQTTLQLILRSLGLTGSPGSLANVSKPTLAVLLAAIRRLRDKTAADLEDTVSKHLEQHPNPPDKQFHAWAENKGVEVDDAEASAYRLASTHAKFREDGKANEQGVTPATVDPEELRMGTEVEHEHTPDVATAKRIATDHLAEIPDYYTRLKRMEDEAKADKTAAEYGWVAGYLAKSASIDGDTATEYSTTAKPDRERLRRQPQQQPDAAPGSAEAVPEQQPEADGNLHMTPKRDVGTVSTHAQELDACQANMGPALQNMLKTPEEKKLSLPFKSNAQPGAGIERSRRVVGSGVEA